MAKKKKCSSCSSTGLKDSMAVVIDGLLLALGLLILVSGILSQVRGDLSLGWVFVKYAIAFILIRVSYAVKMKQFALK